MSSMEIEAKLNAVDSKQYYMLGGLSVLSTSNEEDALSEAGSEDVETIAHRYDPPTSATSPASKVHTSYRNNNDEQSILRYNGSEVGSPKSLAEEFLETSIANGESQRSKNDRNKIEPKAPPPDVVASSNCRRKIQPLDLSSDSSSSVEEYISGRLEDEDWDMILDSSLAPSNTIEAGIEAAEAEPVDVVVRHQPSASASKGSGFYRNSRRMVVQHVQGVDVIKPNCGNCCTIQ